jgi:fatty-acid peroxygenase
MHDDEEAACFVQEVRRLYPFFPATMARLRRDVVWKGRSLPAGRRVLLDLYGTNRDARTWTEPDEFRPERFRGRQIGAFELVPQGGGDHHLNHRCPGEWITIRLMTTAVKILAQEFAYDVPPQDLALDMSRLPALPPDRFVIAGIRSVEPRQGAGGEEAVP